MKFIQAEIKFLRICFVRLLGRGGNFSSTEIYSTQQHWSIAAKLVIPGTINILANIILAECKFKTIASRRQRALMLMRGSYSLKTQQQLSTHSIIRAII